MSLPSDRHVEIETPEHVALGFELAGPGSRFAAFLFDASIIIAALLTLILAWVIFGAALRPPPMAGGVIAAILIVLAFLVFWGYFAAFEAWQEGQTPGKRRFGLRVVHEGGYPLTIRGAAVRNLVRILDWQPFPSWGLGGIFVLLHPRAQRLGDMAAGTIVVRERAVAALPEEQQSTGPPRLSDAEYEVLREYALRRDALEGAARARVAAKLAPHFARHVDVAASRLVNPENPKHADLVLITVYGDESGRRMGTGAATGSGSAAAATLLRRQRPRWAEYGALLRRARADGLSTLPEAEVSRFAALYREVAADLARARTYGASPELLYTLERSVGSGHNLLYRSPPQSARRAWQWLAHGFPQLVRARSGIILLAAALLFGPGIISYTAIALEPDRARTIVPAGLIANAEEGAARQARGQGYAEVPPTAMPVFSSRIITNNVQVAFLAFAGGALAGAGTLLILLFNGIFLGAVAGLYHAEGLQLYFWTFVLPHGVIELTAICIAGGAGLWLGSALIVPGRRTRRAVLVERGREAVSLVAGVAVLLVIAGIIEGFISPSLLPWPAKFAFSALTFIVLSAYIAGGGRAVPATADPAA